MITTCGSRVEKFCGCCYVTGGITCTLSGFKCVVRCDVCRAVTKGAGDAMDGIVSGCGIKGSVVIPCRSTGNGLQCEGFCGRKFGHGPPVCCARMGSLSCAVTVPRPALARQLSTEAYRLYKGIKPMIVHRIEGLGRLGKGARYSELVLRGREGALIIYRGYCTGVRDRTGWDRIVGKRPCT